MRFWQKATQQPWAITQPALTTILEIAARNNEHPETVAAKLGRDLNNSYAIKPHEGVMEIPITGPLFRYANLFTLISGATSYERITNDIQSALESEDIGAIILNIDSPGGEVNGCSELAQLIFSARGTKPIIAYASGDCASGAYWIASACDRIVAADTASLGSIGVVAMVDAKDKDDKILEFVSSQSPHKRLDFDVDADQKRLQQRVDDLAQIFIDNVAQHRGVSAGTVQSDFGQGAVLIGKKAVQVGLADELGTFETVLSALVVNDSSPEHSDDLSPKPLSKNELIQHDSQETIMDLEKLLAAHPSLCQQLIDQGETKATKRIGEILSCDAAVNRFPLAQHLALNTTLAVDIVKTALGVMPEQKTPAALSPEAHKKTGAQGSENTPGHTDFLQVMGSLPNPKIVPMGDGDEEGETEEAVAKRVAECFT